MSDLYSVSLDELLKEDKNMLRHLAETTETANKRFRMSKRLLVGIYAAIWVLFIPIFWVLVFLPNEFSFSIDSLIHQDVMFRVFYPLCTGVIAVIIGMKGYFGKLKWLYIPVNGIMFAVGDFSTWSLRWYLFILYSEEGAHFVLWDYIEKFLDAEIDDVFTSYPLTGIIAAALGLFIGLFVRYYHLSKLTRTNDKAFVQDNPPM